MITTMTALLQAAGSAAAGSGISFWIMIIALFAIMYFFMIRPQQKKQKEIEKFRKALHVGQEVITAGGIHGIIRQIEEVSNVIVLEVAKDVKIRVDRACIYADSASPERTQQLLDLGIDNIQSVVKTPIEAGIDQLWQYKIHVHPKCKNIWNEFNNYVFDTDNIGNTLNRPKDENNHKKLM